MLSVTYTCGCRAAGDNVASSCPIHTSHPIKEKPMKELKLLKLRLSNLELRTCDECLLDAPPHTRMEIVQWGGRETCWTIAAWDLGSEGYNLHFIGQRPFALDVSAVDFMRLAAFGQEELDKFFMEDTDGC